MSVGVTPAFVQNFVMKESEVYHSVPLTSPNDIANIIIVFKLIGIG